MRRSPLRRGRPVDRSAEPGYRAWHEPISGRCALCGERGVLQRHHVVTEQRVRLMRGDPWDLANSLALGRYCSCHRSHHQAVRRVPASKLTTENLAFAVRLLGEGAAAEYFARHYSAC